MVTALNTFRQNSNHVEITDWDGFLNLRAAVKLASSSPINPSDTSFLCELEPFHTEQVRNWIIEHNGESRDPGDTKFVAHKLKSYGNWVRDYLSPLTPQIVVQTEPDNGGTPLLFLFGGQYAGDHVPPFMEIASIKERVFSFVDLLSKHKLSQLRGIMPFEVYPYRKANVFLNADFMANYLASGSYIFFDERPVILEEGEEITSDLTQRKFRDYPEFTKTLLPLGNTPNAVVLYQCTAGYDYNFFIIPCAFHKIFDHTQSASNLRNTWKVLMHKLGNSFDATFSDPELLKKRAKSNVLTGLTQFFRAGVQNKENELANVLTERDEAGTQYNYLVGRAKLLAYELEGLKNNSSTMDEITKVASEEVDDIFKIKKVERVDCNGRHLIFHTNFLYFHNPDTNVVHQLGRMEITADLLNFSLKFKNKTHKFRGNYDHPHILKGNICYGNFGIGLPELIQQGRVGVFVDMVIAFLETCNPKDEWGAMAIYWPVKDESAANPQWADLKAARHKDYIMRAAPEPAKPVTDDDLLDAHNEAKGLKTKKKPQVTLENLVTDALAAAPPSPFNLAELLQEAENNDDHPEDDDEPEIEYDDDYFEEDEPLDNNL